jgi:predicted nucleic-acid-binding Zn-ribbon protein
MKCPKCKNTNMTRQTVMLTPHVEHPNLMMSDVYTVKAHVCPDCGFMRTKPLPLLVTKTI